MATDASLRGVYIPIITPFSGDGSVATDTLERLCHEYLDAGAAGVMLPRMDTAEQVRALGRATMGVKVMAVGDTKIASIATFTMTRPAQTQLDLPR